MKMVYEYTPIRAGTILIFLDNEQTGSKYRGVKALVVKDFSGGGYIEIEIPNMYIANAGKFIEDSPIMGEGKPRFAIVEQKSFGAWIKERGL